MEGSQLDGLEIRPIPIQEARAYLQRQGIDPNRTARVVSALVEAFSSGTVDSATVHETPHAGPPVQRYRLRPTSLGSVRPGVNLDKALALADVLEDEQWMNEIEQQK
jgi:hypothetical protein